MRQRKKDYEKRAFLRKLFFDLDLNNAEGTEHRRNQDRKDTNGCDIADHHHEHAAALEFTRGFDLLDQRLGLEEIADEQTGGKGNDRHQHTVACEVEEIKELHTDDLDVCPCTVTERGRNTQKQANAEDGKAAGNTLPLQLILNDRFDRSG